LRQQTNYLLTAAPVSAVKFSVAVHRTIDVLRSNPERGNIAEFESPRLAEFRWMSIVGFPNYILWYRLLGMEVEVVRLLHAAQDAETELD